MRMVSRFSIAMLLSGITAQAHAFPSIADEQTGRTIYQLSPSVQSEMVDGALVGPVEYYALYYHQDSTTGDHLVYRSRPGSDFRVSYWRLNLHDGSPPVRLTALGQCSGAFVKNTHLYCLSPGIGIQRINILKPESSGVTVCPTSPGYTYYGEVVVNSDETALLFTETLTGATVQDRLQHCVLGSTPATSTFSVATSGHTASTGQRIEHVQWSPKDPLTFTYALHELAPRPFGESLVHVSGHWNSGTSFTKTNITVNGSTHKLMHPFFGTDGVLWSDYDLRWENQFSYVGIAMPFSNQVLPYRIDPLHTSTWSHHQNHGRDARWFVGDGTGTESASFGNGAIKQMKFAPGANGIWARTWYPLASARGTYGGASPVQANARYVPSKNWVIWNAYRTLQGVDTTYSNIFAVEATVVTSDTFPIASSFGTDWDIRVNASGNAEAGYWTWNGEVATWVGSGSFGFTQIVATPPRQGVPPGSGQLWGVKDGQVPQALQWNGSSWINRGDVRQLAIDCTNTVWGLNVYGQVVRLSGASWEALGGGFTTSLYMDGCTLSGTSWGNRVYWNGYFWALAT